MPRIGINAVANVEGRTRPEGRKFMISIIIGMQFNTQIEFDVCMTRETSEKRTRFILHIVVQGVVEST